MSGMHKVFKESVPLPAERMQIQAWRDGPAILFSALCLDFSWCLVQAWSELSSQISKCMQAPSRYVGTALCKANGL